MSLKAANVTKRSASQGKGRRGREVASHIAGTVNASSEYVMARAVGALPSRLPKSGFTKITAKSAIKMTFAERSKLRTNVGDGGAGAAKWLTLRA
jgi:hypothetical protein